MLFAQRVPVAVACASAAVLGAGAVSAAADPVPTPGTPNQLFAPAFSPSTFANPGAALRPKFRWWQPVAYTNDAEIRNEVQNMASGGGGGFEQNGFPVSMNSGGDTTQFLTYANSQEFNAIYGWGTPLWSHRTEVYQTAAAQDGVIGDMNEGSRWNNSVPAVYSQNQAAAAKQIVFGDAQYLPGTNPSGELPTQTAASPGVSSVLCSPANPGDTNVQLNSIAGLLAGDQIRMGQGPAQETGTIASVGTASPCVPLSQAASAGSSTINVAPTSSTTGVTGTANSPAQFVPGEMVTIGSGAGRETDTIQSIGTYDVATSPTTLSVAAAPGAVNVELASVANFLVGDTIVFDRGTAAQESRTITTVGGAGVGTTLSATPAAGALQISVASASGLAAGTYITVGTVNPVSPATLSGDTEVVRIASVSGATLSLYTPLANAHASGEPVALQSIGVTFTPALSNAHAAASTAIDTGTGIKLQTPLVNAHPIGDNFVAPGTGVTLTAPLTKAHAVGANTATSTTLSLLSPPGATNIKVASVTALLVGDTLTIGQPGFLETATISAVGTAGATGTGVTLSSPLARAHYSTDPVVDATSRPIAPTTLAAASAAAATTVDVASATGMTTGDALTIGAPGFTEAKVIAAGGIGTAGAGPGGGTVVTLTTALTYAHSAGDPVADTVNPGANASAGLSDVAVETPIAVELVQCLPPSVADPLVGASTTLSAATVAGATNVKVASVTNLSAGDQLTIGTGAAAETRTIAAGGVGTTGAGGTGVTLTSALTNAHSSGDSVYDTCGTAPTGGTRSLDPTTTVNVTSQVTASPLNYTQGSLNYASNGGVLPAGNGQPWELVSLYQTADGQTLAGGTPTSPVYVLDHLSAAGAQAMADYFDNNILNDPATQAAIAYEDAHNGQPAVFEDSLELSSNEKWTPAMLSAWQSDRGYDPTAVLPALAGTGSNGTTVGPFDFPQSDGQGATLGARVREDYRQMWSDLFSDKYEQTLASWASSRGMLARFQAYGAPIDEGDGAAHQGIAEGEGFEFNGSDPAQQFKVVSSGTYMTGNKVVSSECCAMSGQAFADTFGLDGTGTGAAGSSAANATEVYPGEAGGLTQIVWHGWPYTVGAAGSSALWPGGTFGGDTSFSAANGPNQPQFADDHNVFNNLARIALAMRQGQPAFDVAVYHQDIGLTGQGGDNVTSGEGLGTPGVTTGKILRSSSSLAQAGYSYGYLSPEFFRYPTATFAVDPNQIDQGLLAQDNKVLFPGHGDYKALVIYDQSVMPVDVAQKIATLSGEGLPVLIIGQVPNAAPSAAGGTLAGMSSADAAVQTEMAQVVASPNTLRVADLTAASSQSSDGNAPAALAQLGVLPAMTLSTAATATPLLDVRRHDPATGTDYYYLFNPNATATVSQSITLTGYGTPYVLNTWAGTVSPIADYSSSGQKVTLSVRLAPDNVKLIAISTSDPGQTAATPSLHATSTTANATASPSDNVTYNSSGQLVARASTTGTYTTTLSDGSTVSSAITVPNIGAAPGPTQLTNWQLSVDSWGPTASGNATLTSHTAIPATGTFAVAPLPGVSTGVLPAWTAITPQNGFPVADNLTNAAGIGTYSTTFTLPAGWSPSNAGAYLNVGVAVDTVDIWVNGTPVSGVDQNDRNQVDIGPWLQAGTNTLTITVATPLRNAVAIAPTTPAGGQVANSSETIGALQGGSHQNTTGLIGPVTLTPYGVSAALSTSSATGSGSVSVTATVSGSVGSSVPGALSLSLSTTSISFGSFSPGNGATTYSTTVAATATTTAGATALTVSDPDTSANSGHLVNGSFALAQALRAQAVDSGSQGGVSTGWATTACPTRRLRC